MVLPLPLRTTHIKQARFPFSLLRAAYGLASTDLPLAHQACFSCSSCASAGSMFERQVCGKVQADGICIGAWVTGASDGSQGRHLTSLFI